MLKTPFELFSDTTREEHPLSFLSPDEKCYAFAKAERGFLYVIRNGSTWKVALTYKRNQKTAKVLWRRYAPEFPTPPSAAKLEYFAKVIDDNFVMPKKKAWPKDTQAKKFYAWEKETTHLYDLNQYQAISYAIKTCKTICEDFGWKYPIKVRYLKQRKNYAYGGFSYGSNIDILDPNVQTILHEVAHIAHNRLAKELTGTMARNHAAHGPEFVAIYAFLFKKYTGFKTILESLNWEQISIDMDLYNKLVDLYWEKREPKIEKVSES